MILEFSASLFAGGTCILKLVVILVKNDNGYFLGVTIVLECHYSCCQKQKKKIRKKRYAFVDFEGN